MHDPYQRDVEEAIYLSFEGAKDAVDILSEAPYWYVPDDGSQRQYDAIDILKDDLYLGRAAQMIDSAYDSEEGRELAESMDLDDRRAFDGCVAEQWSMYGHNDCNCLWTTVRVKKIKLGFALEAQMPSKRRNSRNAEACVGESGRRKSLNRNGFAVRKINVA